MGSNRARTPGVVKAMEFDSSILRYADVAQLVERNLAKVEVHGFETRHLLHACEALPAMCQPSKLKNGVRLPARAPHESLQGCPLGALLRLVDERHNGVRMSVERRDGKGHQD